MNYDKHSVINAPVGMMPNLSGMVSQVSDSVNLEDYYFVTTHFNIVGFDRTAATYFEWLPTLGPIADRLKVYEMVLDEDKQQIPGSKVYRGRRPDNCLWQKETLLNLALLDMPKNAKYFCWLDHDIVFEVPTWLDTLQHHFDNGFEAVQLFATIRYLDSNRVVTHVNSGRIRNKVHGFQTAYGNPGGPWAATKETLKILNGFYEGNILGGGDQMFFSAIRDRTLCHDTLLYPIPFVQDVCRYLERPLKFSTTYLDTNVYHLYHGSKENRRYASRYKVLVDHWYNPLRDIRLDYNGLLRFSEEAKPEFIKDVLNYFEERKEDE